MQKNPNKDLGCVYINERVVPRKCPQKPLSLYVGFAFDYAPLTTNLSPLKMGSTLATSAVRQ
jgi:hypothetical protein